LGVLDPDPIVFGFGNQFLFIQKLLGMPKSMMNIPIFRGGFPYFSWLFMVKSVNHPFLLVKSLGHAPCFPVPRPDHDAEIPDASSDVQAQKLKESSEGPGDAVEDDGNWHVTCQSRWDITMAL